MCADCQLSAQQANDETTLRQIRDNFGTFGWFIFHLLKVGGRAGVLMQTCVPLDCQLMAPQANGGPAQLLTTPCGGGLGLEDLLYQVAVVYSEIQRCVSTVFV